MSAHNDLEQLYQCKANRLNVVADPGNGGTIHFVKDDAVCLLTINSAGQTRLLDSASNLPLGVRITVVADQITGGGTCTLQGETFDVEGERAVFEVVQYDGSNAWVATTSTSPATTTRTVAVPIFDWRVHDAPLTPLGLTALSADDLIFTPGTFGADAPVLKGSDVGGTSVIQYARRQIAVPGDYVAGASISLVVKAGMQVVADTSATLTAVVYRTAAPTADLYNLSAKNINSATLANQTFALTPTNVVPGDLLDVLILTAVVDAGNAANNINSIISEVKLSYTAYL